jgi:hypothetical protein
MVLGADVAGAVESVGEGATTGWDYTGDELRRAGPVHHLVAVEPAEQTHRGSARRAREPLHGGKLDRLSLRDLARRPWCR